MTNPTTEELRELLGKVTQGTWREGGHYGAVVSDIPSGYDDNESVSIYGGYMVCESVLDHNMPLILQARELAAEVVRLREALDWAVSSQPSDDSCCAWVHEARQALSQK